MSGPAIAGLRTKNFRAVSATLASGALCTGPTRDVEKWRALAFVHVLLPAFDAGAHHCDSEMTADGRDRFSTSYQQSMAAA
ncbi:MAG: hypothetical protein R3D51_18690 [Hyphomicrobiaceae bacterium]